MKLFTRKALVPLIALAALLIIIAWMAGAFREKIEPETLTVENVTGDQPLVVTRVEQINTEPVPAGIGARQATTISSRTLARITQITVRAGDSVTEGQLLIELEQSDLRSRLEQAREQVRAVEARSVEARQNLERAEQLHQQDLVADAQLDEARSRNDSTMAELAAARQAVKEAEVALSFAEIRSPIDGRVVERFAEPGDTASPGERLLSLYNPSSLRVEAPVREALALSLELEQELYVEIPSLGVTLPARIEERVPAANPGARTFMIKARLEPDARLLPGMYARLMVPTGTGERILIPRTYTQSFGQLDVVWVQQGNNVTRRFIRLGPEIPPDRIEVISGLDAGETIVLPRP